MPPWQPRSPVCARNPRPLIESTRQTPLLRKLNDYLVPCGRGLKLLLLAFGRLGDRLGVEVADIAVEQKSQKGCIAATVHLINDAREVSLTLFRFSNRVWFVGKALVFLHVDRRITAVVMLDLNGVLFVCGEHQPRKVVDLD